MTSFDFIFRQVWGGLVRKWLEEVIPPQSEIPPNAFTKLQISVTPTITASKLVSQFKTRSQVIEACMASCHVPLFLDGKPSTEYNG
jgi:hypothetical protein